MKVGKPRYCRLNLNLFYLNRYIMLITWTKQSKFLSANGFVIPTFGSAASSYCWPRNSVHLLEANMHYTDMRFTLIRPYHRLSSSWPVFPISHSRPWISPFSRCAWPIENSVLIIIKPRKSCWKDVLGAMRHRGRPTNRRAATERPWPTKVCTKPTAALSRGRSYKMCQ